MFLQLTPLSLLSTSMLLLWSSLYSRRFNKTELISYKGSLHLDCLFKRRDKLQSITFFSFFFFFFLFFSSVAKFVVGNYKCQCLLVECPVFVLQFLVTNWPLYVGHCTPLQPGTLTFFLHTCNIRKMQLFCLHKYIYSLHFMYNKSTILNAETQTFFSFFSLWHY